jgi:hypothetical protein
MRLLALLAKRLDEARRRRAARRELHGHSRPGIGAGSAPELARAALRPDQGTWLIARAVSLRAF